jgi:hypothetical protein
MNTPIERLQTALEAGSDPEFRIRTSVLRILRLPCLGHNGFALTVAAK